MQKLIGCILILLSTTAGGFLYGVEQQQYLEKLMYIRHILELIQGEIEYSGAPLFEVFGKTANRVQEPYRSWMLDLKRRVEARGGQSFRGIWEACTETKLKELHLKSRHMRELSEVGMYLGQMDVRTGRTSMQMYLENLGAEIEETRQEITAKKRIGNWLGVMSGLFLVIGVIFKIAAVGILVSILSQVLKHSGREEQAFLTSFAGLILVLSWVLPYIYELFASMKRLFSL